MRLAVDLDGVVLDFATAIDKEAEERYGQEPVPHDCWDFNQKWKNPGWMSIIMADRDFWRKVEPYPGAIEGLRRLHKLGHDITFITHRPLEADSGTDYTLGYWELWHQMVQVIGNKSAEAVKRGIEWAVDDLPKTITHYGQVGITAYLFDRPWNQEADHPRVFDWDHLIQVVEEGASGLRD